jgi:DNA-binding transcriptional MerR regulator
MSNLAMQKSASQEEGTSYKKVDQTAILEPGDVKAGKKAQGAFRTISEVADELDVQQHVLRFWETKFSQVKPLKRGGGRRYYRPEDVALLKHIHHLLYTEGYTIKGVQKLLKGQGKNQIAAQQMANEMPEQAVSSKVQTPAANAPQAVPEAPSAPAIALSGNQREALESMLDELKALRALFPQEEANAA